MNRIAGLMLSAAVFSGCARADTENFDRGVPGKVPSGWSAAITGSGEARWAVEPDDSGPSKPHVLRQSGEVPRGSFPLCLAGGAAIKDGFVEVKFKSVRGKIDQAAGLVWRLRDANNYYVVRANALEDNVVLYKVENANRTALEIVGRTGGYGVDAPVAKTRWHTLRVEFAGRRFTVSLNGRKLFDVDDPTFGEAGKVGLWTKADSVMLFDDFSSGSK